MPAEKKKPLTSPADPIFTPSELYELLKFNIQNYFPMLIVGKPGQGKTAITEQVAAELKFRMIKTHPVTDDPTDYKGLPATIIEPDGRKRAEFLPFGNLDRLIRSDVPTVHFADDLGPAAKMVQAAYMQLVQGRSVNGHRVKDHVVFIGATNRKQDKAAVQSIIEPLKGKYFTVVELVSSLKDWADWYLKQEVEILNPKDKKGENKIMVPLPHEILSWVRYCPGVLDEWEPTSDMSLKPTPRGVEHVAKMLLFGIPEHLQLRAFAGAIGTHRATDFIAFLRIYQNLPDPDAIILKPGKGKIPEEPGHLYALCGALAARASESNIENIIEYAERLPEEFSVLLVKDAVSKNYEKHTRNKPFKEWLKTHEDVLI